MIDLIIKKLIPEKVDINTESVRLKCAMFSGITGIICNIVLFILKFLIGTVVHSIAVVSDAFNNLSDCLSSIVEIVGYFLAKLPEDKKHPFGYGRVEYLAALIVAALILMFGCGLIHDSIQKIFSHETTEISVLLCVLLIISMMLKVILSLLNWSLGKRIDSPVLLAVGLEARNDVFATCITIAALFIGHYFAYIPFDGIAGALVSLLVFYSGFEIIRDVTDKLLGRAASADLCAEISKLIMEHKKIICVHNMIVHEYGPGRLFGSAHVEVNAHTDLISVHEEIAGAEHEILEKYHVKMVLQPVPVDYDDPKTQYFKEKVVQILHEADSEAIVNDFRMISSRNHINLVFSIQQPAGDKKPLEYLKKEINRAVNRNEDVPVYTYIDFDHVYIEEDDD